VFYAIPQSKIDARSACRQYKQFFEKEKNMRNSIICTVILLSVVLVSSSLAEWTTPVPVESGINTQYGDWLPYLSYDGLSLYFARDYSGYPDARIFEAKRSQPSGNFTSVSQVLSSPNGHVLSPWVSPDNLRMYYHEESGTWQIKMSQRAFVNDPWPQGNVVAGLPSVSICAPSLSSDELTMVFNNPNVGGWDMYIATRTSRTSAFSNVRSLSEINTAGSDMRPFLSPDALSIYYGESTGQIFEATRQSINDPFGNAQHLSAFDMPYGSAHPSISISSDGKTFFLVSSPSPGQPGDIYVSYLVPEPATLLLLCLGAAILRRKR
jgi:Tol biopolymer transport system component